jgi:hypothetical protein
MGLLGGDLIAIDRSKFKAVDTSDLNFSEKNFRKQIKEIEKRLRRIWLIWIEVMSGKQKFKRSVVRG